MSAFYIVEVDNDGFKVYNSSGTLIDPATEGTLQSVDTVLKAIRDTAGIKKITDALPVGDNILGRVKLTDGTYLVGVTASGLLKVETEQAAGTFQNIRLADGNSSILADVVADAVDALNRLAIVGKVSIVNPAAPPATTPQTYSGTPLNFSGTDDTVFNIPDGAALTIQSIFAGAEGDPTEKASKVEVFYTPDAGATEKIIDRVYLSGATVSIFPDTSKARDGTALTGVATNQGRIIIRRTHFGGSSKELDCVVRGYTQ